MRPGPQTFSCYGNDLPHESRGLSTKIAFAGENSGFSFEQFSVVTPRALELSNTFFSFLAVGFSLCVCAHPPGV
jgi:hypothetical protein